MAPFFGSFAAALSTMQPASQQQQRAKDQGPLGGLPAAVSAAINSVQPGKVVPAAPTEPGKIVMYSPEYYYTCAIGGIASCGLTHTAVTPLDVVKCNMQTDPAKYKTIGSGFSIVLKEQGAAGLLRGWLPTLLGYSAQGAFKFGLVRRLARAGGGRRAMGAGGSP
jgi:solute carrier family 25 phosphate transporter 3